MLATRTGVDHTLPRYTGPEALPRRSGVARVRWPKHLLVATDGTSAGAPAIRAASRLFEAAGASVGIVAVHAPRIPIPQSVSGVGGNRCERADRGAAARLLAACRHQLAQVIPARANRQDWSVSLEVGDPGATLVRLATERGSDLVVVGLAQREPLDERASGRTTVCAIRHLRVPLLAVADGGAEPTRCVVVFPTGRVHERTIRNALALLRTPAHVWFAFPDRRSTSHPELFDSAAASVLLDRARADRAPSEVTVTRVDLFGDPLTSVLQLVDQVRADLIALPIHGRPGAVRTFLPNLAEPLLLSARRSVLVVPDV